ADDLAAIDRERNVAIRHEPAEAFRALLDEEQRRHGHQLSAVAVVARPKRRSLQRAHGSERSPFGRQPAISMMTTPQIMRSRPRPASGPAPSVAVMSCESGMSTMDPSTGPHSRPSPPTTAAIIGRMFQFTSRT